LIEIKKKIDFISNRIEKINRVSRNE